MRLSFRPASTAAALLGASLVALVLPCRLLAQQSTVPKFSTPLPAQAFAASTGAVTLDLKNYVTLAGVTGQVAQFDTVLGKFNVELLATDAPKTVANFLNYVNRGAYTKTFIHRSVPGFVIQGGGFVLNNNSINAITTDAPVQNEFKNSNVRGTLAMAKTDAGPDTATSQWFVNLADNSSNLDNQNGGFTVFARVLGSGMSVVDAIASVQSYDASTLLNSAVFNQLPLLAASLSAENILLVRTIRVLPVYPPTDGTDSVLTFAATSSNTGVVTAALSGTVLTLTPVSVGSATVTVNVTDTNGATATDTIAVTIAAVPGLPEITMQPVPQIWIPSGTSSTVVFTVAATGVPAPTYQWRRNGVNVTGKTTPTYVLTNASDAQAGTFTCVVTNSFGSVASQLSTLAVVPTTDRGRLSNLSILTSLAAGESLTMGTVIGGTDTNGTKALLARAAGPSLIPLGVSNVLPDPTMALASPTGSVDTNNDWQGSAALRNVFTQVGAFAYASDNSKDAAIYRPALSAGGYTIKVSDTGSGTGKVIAELYDATLPSAFTLTTPRLINVSVIKQIATDDTLTTGFYISGATAKTVLIRAIGPSLSQFSVPNLMADPRLALFNASGSKLAENDNWGGDTQLTQVGSAVGAFDPANASSKDAILLITLAPGSYSAQVSGIGAGGTALVEVYEVP